MGYEKAEPNNKMILLVGVLSVVTLAALQPLFFSYFEIMTGNWIRESQQENADYYRSGAEIMAEQRAQLHNAPIPIDRAMQVLATDGRGSIPMFQSAPTDPEQQVAVEAGWSHHPTYVAPGSEESAAVPAEELQAPDAETIDQIEAAVDELEAELDQDRPTQPELVEAPEQE